jgi:hypothetical protein
VKPEINRDRLALDVLEWMKGLGLSTRSASTAYPGLNPAMISRACTGQVLSAASLLALCRAMEKDPMSYLVCPARTVENQVVTAIGKRETAGVRP